jgi:hypothetical protein
MIKLQREINQGGLKLEEGLKCLKENDVLLDKLKFKINLLWRKCRTNKWEKKKLIMIMIMNEFNLLLTQLM